MADEAHRSQYGFVEGGARWMREALPNATFVGFTGTPLERHDKNTIHVFGEYADVYDIRQAVEDGATRPRGLHHDKARKIKQTPDVTIERKKYKMDLLPWALVVSRFFAEELAAIEALQTAAESAAREREEQVEEQASAGESGEELLERVLNDKNADALVPSRQQRLRRCRGGHLRSNIHVGGKVVRGEITGGDRHIVERVTPKLREDGLYFVGLDVIGGKLTEVNVTSPTGIQQMSRLDGRNCQAPVIDWIERTIGSTLPNATR